MSFVQRRIALTFQLGTGAYGEDGYNTVRVTGLRCSAAITKAGGVSNSELDLRVWGMSLDLMNKLTILNQQLDQNRHNIVIVEAGDDDSGMAVVFAGTLVEAWPTSAPLPRLPSSPRRAPPTPTRCGPSFPPRSRAPPTSP